MINIIKPLHIIKKIIIKFFRGDLIDSIKKYFIIKKNQKYSKASIDKICNNKDIVFITHELSRTGAPILLYKTVLESIELGFKPIVVSQTNGPLKEDFIKKNIDVIILNNSRYHISKIFKYLLSKFSIVFCNTIVTGKVVKKLSNSRIKVIWWIHEGKFALKEFSTLMPKKVGKNIKIYSVSNYCSQMINEKFPNYNIKLFRPYINNYQFKEKRNYKKSKRIRLLFNGNLESRKGFDIIVRAFFSIPIQYRSKFIIDCYGEFKNKDIFRLNPDSFILHKKIPETKFLEKIKESNCILIPSREETLSLVAIQAITMNVPIICSNNIGAVNDIPNSKNFKNIFYENSYLELSKLLIDFIDEKYSFCFSKSITDYIKNIYSKKINKQNLELMLKK